MPAGQSGGTMRRGSTRRRHVPLAVNLTSRHGPLQRHGQKGSPFKRLGSWPRRPHWATFSASRCRRLSRVGRSWLRRCHDRSPRVPASPEGRRSERAWGGLGPRIGHPRGATMLRHWGGVPPKTGQSKAVRDIDLNDETNSVICVTGSGQANFEVRVASRLGDAPPRGPHPTWLSRGYPQPRPGLIGSAREARLICRAAFPRFARAPGQAGVPLSRGANARCRSGRIVRESSGGAKMAVFINDFA